MLEDLSPAKAGSQIKGCTVDQCSEILSALAEIHGRFWQKESMPPEDPKRFAGIIRYNMEQCMKQFSKRYHSMMNGIAEDFEWIRENDGVA